MLKSDWLEHWNVRQKNPIALASHWEGLASSHVHEHLHVSQAPPPQYRELPWLSAPFWNANQNQKYIRTWTWIWDCEECLEVFSLINTCNRNEFCVLCSSLTREIWHCRKAWCLKLRVSSILGFVPLRHGVSYTLELNSFIVQGFPWFLTSTAVFLNIPTIFYFFHVCVIFFMIGQIYSHSVVVVVVSVVNDLLFSIRIKAGHAQLQTLKNV